MGWFLTHRLSHVLAKMTIKNSFTVDQIVKLIDKPFLYVDYNELIDTDTVMLSQTDTKNNYAGFPVALYVGLKIVGYQEDEDISGRRDDLIAEGVCILNTTGHINHVKWFLKMDDTGIQYVSDILAKSIKNESTNGSGSISNV